MLPVLPGMLPAPAALLDERGRPDFRDLFGRLAARSTEISTAITRVRLSTVDLTEEELAGVRRFRVLVAELNALQIDGEARATQADPGKRGRVERLSSMLESGRLEVRAAPLGGWSPDFSVFSREGTPLAVVCGYHWFERPYPHRGPALASLHGAEPARVAGQRHAELWEQAHDVGPAVWSILSEARRMALSFASPAG